MTNAMKLSPRLAQLFLLALVLGLALSGCGGAEYKSAEAPAPGAAYEASAVASAAPEGGVAGGKVAGDGEAKTWARSQIRSNTARLSIGDREELPLVGMQMNVQVEGFRARVVLDCYFRNDRDSRYEGTFQLRLPNEATPYFFAFGPMRAEVAGPPAYLGQEAVKKVAVDPQSLLADRAESWSDPQVARMVPREKAAAAYGETVRRRVDPGLVEWAGAGIFNARVFPLAARKVHRIVIGYDVNLTPVGDDLELAVDVPENAPGAVVDLAVSAPDGLAAEVSPQAPASALPGKKFYRFEGIKERAVTLRLKKPGSLGITGNDARTGDYFAASFRPDLSAAADKSAQGPDAAVFLVDTSLSSNPDRFNVWLSMLAATLENNRDTMKRFAVLFFNVETQWWKPAFVENSKQNVAEMLSFARDLSLEGATDLGAAFGAAAQPGWLDGQAPSAWDLFLLSDGASTWGEGDRFALGKKATSTHTRALYAYQTGMSGTDTGVLEYLTRASGGAVFSVVGESEVAKASVAHRSLPFDLLKVEVAGGSDLLVAGRPRALFPGQSLLLAGRGTLAKDAEVTLTLMRGGQPKVIKTKIAAPIRSGLAPRVYGQLAVAQMEELGAPTEFASTAYATYFRVTGQTCSLLLLESEDDYQRHGIRPEDPGVIKQSEASAVINKVMAAIGSSLGDPRARFFAWLSGLEKMPGMSIQLPAGLREALGTLPVSAFDIDAPALPTKLHAAKELPPDFLRFLSKHEMDYDVFTREAERRRSAAGPADALKALSSMVEEKPGDSVLARDVGFSAMGWGFGGQAYHLFRRVADARPFEPQTYRAMASALVGMNRIDLAIAYFEVGLVGHWDGRFGDFRQILGMEYLHLLRRIALGELKPALREYALGRMSSLQNEITYGNADVVVMITWNTDNTDVDLHVTEPGGEECFYSHRHTSMGGQLTADVTRGYGPEMYVLPKAEGGKYQVRAHFFASDQNRASARTKVQALVFEDWGSPKERVTERTVTLEQGKEMHDIATVSR
jgi:hypothetical protein